MYFCLFFSIKHSKQRSLFHKFSILSSNHPKFAQLSINFYGKSAKDLLTDSTEREKSPVLDGIQTHELMVMRSTHYLDGTTAAPNQLALHSDLEVCCVLVIACYVSPTILKFLKVP